MMMGIYGMALGFLKLGWLLEFISLPILSGFISAVAITIILNQMDSLLGEPNVGDGVPTQIHDIFDQLPQANGYACAIGFTGIILLTVLDQSGKRWGKKNKVIWFLSITRAFLCLVIFTAIGYSVNKDIDNSDNYLFDVAKVKANGIEEPTIPSRKLLSLVASRSIAVFIGSTIEHTAIARAFGVHNNYVTDQSQELCYYGITNFFNSFFHAMGVGGAMSRTAVNSSCNVRSPLSGFLTTAVVLVSIYKLVGTLYWIPKATLAAIIICAVWPLISSPAVFYKYWKTSLADFTSSMIAFWVSLFVSTEIGIAASVGFNIAYCLIRQVFTRTSSIGPENPSSLQSALEASYGVLRDIPADTRIFRFNESVFFPNSYAIKTHIMDSIQTHHAPVYASVHGPEAERNWSVVGEKRVARLRKRARIGDVNRLPPIELVILDFTRANHLDSTAISHLRELVFELRNYGGSDIEVRFVGMSEYVRTRMERGGWRVVDADVQLGEDEEREVTRLYGTVAGAVAAPRMSVFEREGGDLEKRNEKPVVTHNEVV